MLNITKAFFSALGLIVIAVVLALAVNYGINKKETSECLKWQREALKYEGFSIEKWQYGQCLLHSILIDAPIKESN